MGEKKKGAEKMARRSEVGRIVRARVLTYFILYVNRVRRAVVASPLFSVNYRSVKFPGSRAPKRADGCLKYEI